MDTLGDLSSASDSESDGSAHKTTQARKKLKNKGDPDPEALEAAGFKSGPSVLHVPEPAGESSWNWCELASLPVLARLAQAYLTGTREALCVWQLVQSS